MHVSFWQQQENAIAVWPSCATCELYVFACTGYGLTFVLMANRVRFGLHKFAKEGLVCLLESCTAKEVEQVQPQAPRAARGDLLPKPAQSAMSTTYDITTSRITLVSLKFFPSKFSWPRPT